MRSVSLLACCVLALFAWSSPSEGAWGADGASARPSSLAVPGVVAVADGAGGVLLTWDEQSGAVGVYAQRLSSQGVRLWGPDGFQVSSGHASAACSDGAGGLIVAYVDNRVRVQRLSPNGVIQWTAGGLALNNDNLGDRPALCPDGSGGVFVTWQSSTLGNYEIYAQHVSAGGIALWPGANGVRVTALLSSQTQPAITSGQAGSAVVMWIDNRSGNDAVYAQRVVDPSGANAWVANGVSVCSAPNTRSGISLVPDGPGAFATWTDNRNGTFLQAYMQRVAGGNGASLWAADGQLVASGWSGFSELPSPVATGNGILVCWEDTRNGTSDVYAQRYDVNGVAQWGGDAALTQDPGDQTAPVGASDGSGGMVVGWRHWTGYGQAFGRVGRIAATGQLVWPMDGVAANASASMSTVTVATIVSDGAGGAIAGLLGAGDGMPHAQRVLANSNLADFDATITSAIDLPGDEGGFVRLGVSAAIGDLAPGDTPVTGYNVWRRSAAAPTAALVSTGRDDLAAARARGLAALAGGAGARLDAAAATSVGFPPGSWESLGMTGALGLSNYTIAAATRADSTAAGNADETFVVTVQTASSAIWSASPAVVAHSVDNLAPVPPQNLAASPTASQTVTLSWDPNHESDLAWYAVYRGTSTAFVPAPANRIATPASPGYVDGGYTQHYVYKVSAVDRHGNESSATLLDPTPVTGVESGLPATVSLAGAAPNPVTGTTVFEWSLPRATAARLEIFDVHGRLVRELVSGVSSAGTRRTRWDVRDGRGAPVPAGVYLARLRADGTTREHTFVVMP